MSLTPPTRLLQVKMFISFIQVSSLLGQSYDVPWPPAFDAFTKMLRFPANILDLSNLVAPLVWIFSDVGSGFEALQCQHKAASFAGLFKLHVSALPALLLTMIVALGVAVALRKYKDTWRDRFTNSSAISRVLVLINNCIFLLYPGLGVRVVRSFKCLNIYGACLC